MIQEIRKVIAEFDAYVAHCKSAMIKIDPDSMGIKKHSQDLHNLIEAHRHKTVRMMRVKVDKLIYTHKHEK